MGASTAHALEVSPLNANMAYYGTLSSASDAKLKTEVEDMCLTDCQTMFDAVMPRTYSSIDDPNAKRRLGVLAQDIKQNLLGKWDKLVGSFMHGPEDGEKEEMLSVSYDRLALVLWGVCENQQRQLQELTARVDALCATAEPPSLESKYNATKTQILHRQTKQPLAHNTFCSATRCAP